MVTIASPDMTASALNGNIDNKWNYFAPRLGVAYQINQKTVVRIGYGRSFDMGVFGSNFGHAVTQNLPVLAAQNVAAVNNNALATNNNIAAFKLDAGPPLFVFPTVPSNGLLPLAAPLVTCNPTSARPTNACQLSMPGTSRCSVRLTTLHRWKWPTSATRERTYSLVTVTPTT